MGWDYRPVNMRGCWAKSLRLAEFALMTTSCGGVVAELEAKMATLLGKEAAVFLPTGTLANHLAVRLLARTGRRVLVQAESHLWTRVTARRR